MARANIGMRHARRAWRLAPLAALLGSALLTASPSHASPWARADGEIFLSTRADYFIAQEDPPSGSGLAPSRFQRFETNSYAEYGLTRTLTIGGKIAYGTSTYSDSYSAGSESGFSEIEGFGQYEIFRGRRSVLSVKLTGAAPAGLNAGARPELVANGAAAELRALYGRNLFSKPCKIFAGVEAGYRKRFGDDADQIRADALVGAEPAKNILLLIEALSSTSMRNEAGDGADYDVVKLQPSAVWRFSRRFSLQAGVTHEIGGRNLVLGDTYFLSFWTIF